MSTCHRSRILIVDRSETFKRIFSQEFAGAEVECVFCQTGEQALQALCSSAFSIVVSALFLDDMEGIELCRRMRGLKGYAYTPFILFTSSNSAEIARNTLPAGVTEIFNKPDINELVTFIRRFIRYQMESIDARVLYIEDNRSQRMMVKEMFVWRGMTVADYASADEAWPAYLVGEYDLVVTDIVLEGVMSGLNLVNRIRRQEGAKGDVPILAITAFDDISRRIELFNLGVTDYVIKPIIGEELIARVRNLVSPRSLRHAIEVGHAH